MIRELKSKLVKLALAKTQPSTKITLIKKLQYIAQIGLCRSFKGRLENNISKFQIIIFAIKEDTRAQVKVS